jgi:hypothetical protein
VVVVEVVEVVEVRPRATRRRHVPPFFTWKSYRAVFCRSASLANARLAPSENTPPLAFEFTERIDEVIDVCCDSSRAAEALRNRAVEDLLKLIVIVRNVL